MGKASALKLALAFAISGLYIFFFGIMGTIESIETNMGAEATSVSTTTEFKAPAVTSIVEEDGNIIYTYATEINVANGKKPSLGDYTRTEEILIIETPASTTTEKTTVPDFVMSEEDFDYSTPTKATTVLTGVSSDETTPPTTTPSNDTTTKPPESPSTTTTTPQTTTTTTTTTPATTPPTSASTSKSTSNTQTVIPDNNEQFTVNAGGTIISDTAQNIVAMAVMAEIGDGFDEDAIKAQAIATYTYIKYYNDNNKYAYIAKKTPSDKLLKIVGEVIGTGIYYNGDIIQAVYSASSAGYTASSKQVWGVDYPYLQSRETAFDKEYDINYGRKPTFTSSEMADYVYRNTGISLTGDPSKWFTIESYVDNVYVGKMTIGGKSTYNNGKKDVTITGRVFRETIMEYDIRSHCFNISYDSTTDLFTITTYGYGHGVGLSQHGANILGTYYGYTYEQILDFYYPGTYLA